MKAKLTDDLISRQDAQPTASFTRDHANDVISRQAAINALDVLCQEHRYKIPGKMETYSEYNEAWQDALDRAEGLIFNLPSVQPETAKRIVGKSRGGMTLWYQCDMCNESVDAQDNFCRGCGRRSTDG